MKESPILEQYKKIKRQYKDEILLFRIGDFYETFLNDAELASRALNITLTSKPVGKGIRVPLAGIPVKAGDSYIARLLNKGYRVAICEQTGEGKKLMEREVVEVITPGTIQLYSLLDEQTQQYLASFLQKGKTVFCAVCDITTGEFFFFNTNLPVALETLHALDAKEIVISENSVYKPPNFNISVCEPREFDPARAEETIKDFFDVKTVRGFGITKDEEKSVIGALLFYIKDKKKNKLSYIKTVKKLNLSSFLYIDSKTALNLELVKSSIMENSHTLYNILKKTRTPQGSRLLRKTILIPSSDIEFIKKRQLRVETIVENKHILLDLKNTLSEISDMERLVSKISSQKGTPKDIYRLGKDLEVSESVSKILSSKGTFSDLLNDFVVPKSLIADIKRIVKEDAPARIEDFVRQGVDKELDEIRNLLTHTKDKLIEMEKKEKESTGIPSLKIGYNQVFGYYIEVTKPHLSKIPSNYIRKQTLVSSERFITEDLKKFEEQIINAEEIIKKIEQQIFGELVELISKNTSIILKIASKIAEIDLDFAFAEVAIERKYTKPTITSEDAIIIEEGRHPVVEVYGDEPFVPNNTLLDKETRIYLITGPNMAGKSTYLRQVALITIMAHMGSFVPAKKATIGILNRLFSRIGASDDISRGISTFMAEMVETAEILNSADKKSLVILDEIGRGTSTFDGMSIAWSVLEYLSRREVKVLFATHYHELSRLASKIHNIKNYTMDIKEWEGKVYYMRTLKEGVCDRSYGLHVAKLAGLPDTVINRAREVLEDLEKRREKWMNIQKRGEQMSLFNIVQNQECEVGERLVKEMRALDPNKITPKEALKIIYKLKEEYHV